MDATDRNNESFASSEAEQPTFSHNSSQLIDDTSSQNYQSKTRGESATSRSKPKKANKDAKKSKPRVIFNISGYYFPNILLMV